MIAILLRKSLFVFFFVPLVSLEDIVLQPNCATGLLTFIIIIIYYLPLFIL
jgi:hypothetical protein